MATFVATPSNRLHGCFKVKNLTPQRHSGQTTAHWNKLLHLDSLRGYLSNLTWYTHAKDESIVKYTFLMISSLFL